MVCALRSGALQEEDWRAFCTTAPDDKSVGRNQALLKGNRRGQSHHKCSKEVLQYTYRLNLQ